MSSELKQVQVPGFLYPLGIHLASAAPVEEWALLVTLSYLNSSIILKLINLLLMEKSLVVVGSHPAIVSMVSLASKILFYHSNGRAFLCLCTHICQRALWGPSTLYPCTTHAPRESEVSATSAILYLQEQEDSIFLRHSKAVDISNDTLILDKMKEIGGYPDNGESIRSDTLRYIASLNCKQHYPVVDGGMVCEVT